VSRLYQARRPHSGSDVTASQLVLRLIRVEAHVAGQEASVARADEDLGLRQQRVKLIKRAGMVTMRVGQGDPSDREAQLTGRGHDALAETGHPGIDQREAVRLAYQVRIDRKEQRKACQLNQVLA